MGALSLVFSCSHLQSPSGYLVQTWKEVVIYLCYKRHKGKISKIRTLCTACLAWWRMIGVINQAGWTGGHLPTFVFFINHPLRRTVVSRNKVLLLGELIWEILKVVLLPSIHSFLDNRVWGERKATFCVYFFHIICYLVCYRITTMRGQ